MNSITSNFVTSLRCVICGCDYPAEAIYTCPACGEAGILEVQYDYAAIAMQLPRENFFQRPHDIWRYREFLPVNPETPRPHLQVNWTPIYKLPSLAPEIGIAEIFVKDEGRNPTGSFKDRVSAIGAKHCAPFALRKE